MGKLRDNPNKLLNKTVGLLPPMLTTVTITEVTIELAIKDWKSSTAIPAWYNTLLEAEIIGVEE